MKLTLALASLALIVALAIHVEAAPAETYKVTTIGQVKKRYSHTKWTKSGDAPPKWSGEYGQEEQGINTVHWIQRQARSIRDLVQEPILRIARSLSGVFREEPSSPAGNATLPITDPSAHS